MLTGAGTGIPNNPDIFYIALIGVAIL